MWFSEKNKVIHNWIKANLFINHLLSIIIDLNSLISLLKLIMFTKVILSKNSIKWLIRGI